MIYLNNAATSYPKPDIVINSINNALNALPSGQFRSGGILSDDDLFSECRKKLGLVLGIKDADRIFFSSGSTEGLNQILFGLGFRADEYMTTATEHNSVLRPLFNMGSGEPVIISCDENGIVSPENIRKSLNQNIKALVINHCSNVTGAVQDMEEIGRIAKEYGLRLILDCSQSAGCMEIRIDDWNVSACAFTGHKSLMGVQGTGGFYVKKGIELKPLTYGGTGRDSRVIKYEGAYEYETGTRNAPGIAGLASALDFLLETGIDIIEKKERELTEFFVSEIKSIPGVRIYGEEIEKRGPVVSVGISGVKPSDAAYILQNGYGIVTRAGLQCAPLIHKYIGSGEDGVLRLSFSYFTSKEELEAAIDGIKDIAMSAEG
ncbi:cysteine desulfurase family protein [Lachnospiraceae bacterium]|nr:cysteine desulfurase family protein [Lachnospiraceae bacterium]